MVLFAYYKYTYYLCKYKTETHNNLDLAATVIRHIDYGTYH